MAIYIHPTAEVSLQAKIGEGTKIWNQCHIRENAEIGSNCIISKDVYVDYAVKIGSKVKIQNGVSVYNGVTIEDDVFLGPHCVLINDFRPRALNTNWKITPTLIKKGASVGAGAIIICGIELGEYCMIGAGSVVTRSVPSHALVVGNPARVVGYVCKCGEKCSAESIEAKQYICKNCEPHPII